jgi:hypothetical protein
VTRIGSIALGVLLLVAASAAAAPAAPAVSITRAPDDPTTSRSATFRFEVRGGPPGSTLECRLDGNLRSRPPCTDGLRDGLTYDDLALGEHKFVVKLRSGRGEVLDSDSRMWTIVAPSPPPTTTAPTTTAQAPTTTTSAPRRTFPHEPTIIGTSGDDLLKGTSGDDVILGLGGNDTIIGRGGNDTLVGGPGDDRLEGGPGDDELIGGPGRDMLAGGTGNDSLFEVDDARDRFTRGGPGRDHAWADRIDTLGKAAAEYIVAVAPRPILYTKDGDIWAMKDDGTSPVKLVDNGAEPRWSPNGTKIAFYRTMGGGNRELFVMSWTGANVTRLTYTYTDCEWDPSWSPDGHRLAFVIESCDPKKPGEALAHLDLDTPTTYVYMTLSGACWEDPRWRPDGAFVYAYPDSGVARVYRLDPWNAGPLPTQGEARTPMGIGLWGGTDITMVGLDISPSPPFTILYSPKAITDPFSWSRIYAKADTADPSEKGTWLYPGKKPKQKQKQLHDEKPDWNGAGTGILFSAPHLGVGGVWKMAPNGSSRTFLRNGVGSDWR